MKKRLKRNKRVLLVAARISSIREPLKESLKKRGYKVYEFDFRKSSLAEKLIFATSILIPSFWNLGNLFLNRRLIRIARKIKPSLIIVSKGETILKGTVKTLKGVSLTVNWYTDLFETIPRMVNILSEYDFVFTVDNFDVQINKKEMNIYYLPFASNISIKNISFSKRKYDVVFVGTWTKQREELLSKLENVNLFIWGSKQWLESKLARHYQNKWLSPQELLNIFSKAKIAINERQNKKIKYTMPNYRLFEATASGALVLTDELKDLDKLFILDGDKKEMEVYKSNEDLEKKVKYFLENDKERIRIAANGYKRSITDHSYDKRLEEMLKIINFK